MAGIITKAELHSLAGIIADGDDSQGRIVRKADVLVLLGVDYANEYGKGYEAARRDDSTARFNKYQRAGKSEAFLAGFVTFQSGWKKWNDSVTRDGLLAVIIRAEVEAEETEGIDNAIELGEMAVFNPALGPDQLDAMTEGVTGATPAELAAWGDFCRSITEDATLAADVTLADGYVHAPGLVPVTEAEFTAVGEKVLADLDTADNDAETEGAVIAHDMALDAAVAAADTLSAPALAEAGRNARDLADTTLPAPEDDEAFCVFASSYGHISAGCADCERDREAGHNTNALRMADCHEETEADAPARGLSEICPNVPYIY